MQNELKKKLINCEITIGSWITLGSTAITEIMAKAGFDWLVIDLEHSTISIEMAGEMIRIIDLAGVTPLVRLTSNDPDQIKRCLDAGAHGIIVPMVNSSLEAKNAVSAMHYPPKGNRGVGLGRAQGYGANFSQYINWQKDSSVLIVQIENKKAIDNLIDILKVPGVDGVLIGPYDLSCSLGIPGKFKDPVFLNSMETISKVGSKLGIPGGIHIVEPDLDLLKKSIKNNHKFIAYSVDCRILEVGSRIGVESFKGILE